MNEDRSVVVVTARLSESEFKPPMLDASGRSVNCQGSCVAFVNVKVDHRHRGLGFVVFAICQTGTEAFVDRFMSNPLGEELLDPGVGPEHGQLGDTDLAKDSKGNAHEVRSIHGPHIFDVHPDILTLGDGNDGEFAGVREAKFAADLRRFAHSRLGVRRAETRSRGSLALGQGNARGLCARTHAPLPSGVDLVQSETATPAFALRPRGGEHRLCLRLLGQATDAHLHREGLVFVVVVPTS